MFSADISSGYYGIPISSDQNNNVAVQQKPSTADILQAAYTAIKREGRRLHFPKNVVRGYSPMPSLCNCVYTPPPHPGQPRQHPDSGLVETATGPKRAPSEL